MEDLWDFNAYVKRIIMLHTTFKRWPVFKCARLRTEIDLQYEVDITGYSPRVPTKEI